MNVILWIVQVLLAGAFGMAGAMKATQTKEQIIEKRGEQMGWVNDFTDQQLKGIGVLEILAAVGLILPWALNIIPVLTPLAGLGLVLTMAGAAYTHYRRDEQPMIMINGVLGALALFVFLGRI